MKKLLLSLALISASFSSEASLLSFAQPSGQSEGFTLNKIATVNDSKGLPSQFVMDLLGTGVRKKKVLFITAKVYVAELYSNNKAAFERNENALNSLTQNSSFVALKISLLRTLTASTLATSFRDALEANNYSIQGELDTLLNIIENSADAEQGKYITMLMSKNSDGTTNIYYEDVTGKMQSFKGSSELMKKVMSIWLGTPADDGLNDLKNNLLNPVN